MKKIGIIGGGQLALMMLPAIKKLGLYSVVLDRPGSSCEGVADEFISGDFKDPKEILKLSHCDYVTYEIESISLLGYYELAKVTKVAPRPCALEVIQDKGIQKSFLRDHKIPSSEFEVRSLEKDEKLSEKVVKLCRDGYDGRGVWLAKSGEAIPLNFVSKPCVIEDRVDIAKELSQVCCRSTTGDVEFYELVEMVMNPKLNLLDYQINPASVSEEVVAKAKAYAQKILEGLDYVGTLAVELFLTANGELLVNEIAPRVHNSGHNTIESSPTSQFKNHILAISHQALGPSLPARPSLTLNLLGEGQVGPTQIENKISDEETYVHLYNKKESRPGRKMGHVTMIGNTQSLLEKKEIIKKNITITGRST